MVPVTLSPATRHQLGTRASDNIESEVNSAIEGLCRRIPIEVRRSQLSLRLQNRLHSEREFHRVYSHLDVKMDALRGEIHRNMADDRAVLHKEIADARLEMQRQIAESQSSFQRDLWKHTIAVVAGTALALLIALLAK